METVEEVEMGTSPSSAGSQPSKSLSSADLAFIDAAIAMQRASKQLTSGAKAGTAEVALEPALFIGIIQIVVAVVEVATFVYHAVKGRVPTFAALSTQVQVEGDASVSQLIEARNNLAKKLGDSSVLK